METASSGWRQLLSGLVVGLVSVATVLAGILLASQESGGPTPTSVAFATPSIMATWPPAGLPTAFITPGTALPTIAASPAAPTLSPTPGPTASPVPTTACPVPAGWSAYMVRIGDSIESIARATATDIFDIIQGNCLADPDVTPGQVLYLPPYPARSPTPAPAPCGPEIHWVIYRVQPGETLYGLAIRYGTSVPALAWANCMKGYLIRAGQGLYVPPVVVVPPTATPRRVPSATPTSTPTRMPSATPSSTPSPIGPSPSATVTSVAPSHTPTATASIIPTTALPTSSPSSTPPSATPVATDTPQPPTPTVTPSATPTPTPRPSATSSATSPPSATPPPTHTSPPPTGLSPSLTP